jgi:hypothetical protein
MEGITYVFYKMTSIQNKVSLYCSGGKFYKHLVNKLGPRKRIGKYL